MNKKIKLLSLIISVFVIFSSICIISFAQDTETTVEVETADVPIADGENEFEVFNSLFYVVIPKGYPISFDDHYAFFTERNNDSLAIDFYTFKNEAKADASSVSEDNYNSFAKSVLDKIFVSDYYDYEDEYTVLKGVVNGISSLIIKCEVDYEEDEDANDNIFVLTTEETVYAIRFEDYYGFPEDDMKDVLNSFCINGTHFNSEKETNGKDFSGAEEITEVLKTDLMNYDSEAYGNYEVLGTTTENIDEDTFILAFGLAAVITGVPFVAVTVVAIVFIVKYIKKKKKINEFESNIKNSFNNNFNN